MEYLFGGMLLAGVAYLLLMIVGLGDTLDIDGLDGVLGLDSADADGLGCSVIAAFLAGFGALGLTGTLLQWNPILTLIGAIVTGVVLGRIGMSVLRFVYRQQSKPITFDPHDLIGTSARATIDSASGKTGEVLIEAGTILKYPVQEVSDAELRRGDVVEVVGVDGRILQVKKKRG